MYAGHNNKFDKMNTSQQSYRCANYNNNNKIKSEEELEFYYISTMDNLSKNNGKSEMTATSIPMQTVKINNNDRDRNNNNNKSSNYIQCFLPFLCILQIFNVVCICLLFYKYKATDLEFQTLQNDVNKFKHDFNTFKHDFNELEEIATHFNHTKDDSYDYDSHDYSDDDKIENDRHQDTHQIAVLAERTSDEDDNSPPRPTIAKVELTRSRDLTKNETTPPKEDYPSNPPTKKRRSVMQMDQTFDSVYDINKNEAEGDYRDTEKYVPRIQISKANNKKKFSTESVIIPDNSKPLDISPEQNRSEIITNTANENSSMKLIATSSNKNIEKMIDEELLLKALMTLQKRTTIAVHIIGDTSKYREKKEKHYDANHRMYHPKGLFKDWKIDPKINMNEHSSLTTNFKLQDGLLKVKQAGLYYVYAQIYYSAKEDTSGFNILINDEIIMRCISTGISSEQLNGSHTNPTAPNTCFTARIIRIWQDDTLSIKETQGERYTIFEPTRSFFGLYKIG